jgi:hypothetical protein
MRLSKRSTGAGTALAGIPDPNLVEATSQTEYPRTGRALAYVATDADHRASAEEREALGDRSTALHELTVPEDGQLVQREIGR